MKYSVWQAVAPYNDIWELLSVREAFSPARLAKTLAEEGFEGTVRIIDEGGRASFWNCGKVTIYFSNEVRQ